MPRNMRREQAVAIFLSIKRKKGSAAAHRFGRKHRSAFRKIGSSRHSRRVGRRR